VTSIGFSFKPEMLRAWSRNRKKDESAE
jgi:hypothetical protein